MENRRTETHYSNTNTNPVSKKASSNYHPLTHHEKTIKKKEIPSSRAYITKIRRRVIILTNEKAKTMAKNY